MRDNYNDLDVVEALIPQSGTTTGGGKDIDLGGYESVTFALTSSGDNGISWKLEEKDSGGTYSDVDSSDILGSTDEITSEGTAQVGYVGNKELVRINITTVDGTVEFSAVAIKGNARHKPTQ